MENNFIFFTYEKLKIKCSYLQYLDLLEKNEEFLWKFLFKNNQEHLFNLLITIRIFEKKIINFSLSDIEKKVYKGMSFLEIKFCMLQNLEKLLKSCFNEMIKTDLDIIDKNVWVGVNLDTFYFIKLSHLNLKNLSSNKKDPSLYEKILNTNLVISTLDRIDGVFLYNRQVVNNCPKEIVEKIRFTKGYLVCFSPELVKKLKKYKYDRKLIKKKKVVIEILKHPLTLEESLKDDFFSTPIWMSNDNLINCNYKKDNLYNDFLLKEPSNIEKCVENLNYLNSVKFAFNKFLFKKIIDIIKTHTDIDKTLTHKNTLEDFFYKINNSSGIESIEYENNLKSLISSASLIELMETQLKDYKTFFLDNKMDSRIRIYNFPWPINYQLNHIIRCCILFNKNFNFEKILIKFWKNPYIVENVKNFEIFEYKHNKDVKEEIDLFFKKNHIFSLSDNVDMLKKEYFYHLLIKLSPSDIKSASEKFFFVYNLKNEIISKDIEKNWDFWTLILKKKKKKLPYLLNYKESLLNIHQNKFDNVFWLDASSNAIQLITLRLKIFDRYLFKLINVSNNDTCFSNIYEYITEKIKKIDHSSFLKNELNSLISEEDFTKLQDIDNNKFLLMPSTYGMGKISYRKSLNKMLSSDERFLIWEKLNKKQKDKTSDYFWKLACQVLNDINFDMNQYKKICQKFWKNTEYEGFIWITDFGVSIAPINLKHSKRHDILDKINKLKLKKNETYDFTILKKIEDQTKKLKEKLKKDEKSFWKRTLVKSKNNKIFSRIYHPKLNKYYLNKHDTRVALVPNTIHAYDASIIHLVIKICKEIGIEVMVIHDSVGCHSLMIPLVKTIFKVANIVVLKKNKEKVVFPFNTLTSYENTEDFDEICDNILKSENFFK